MIDRTKYMNESEVKQLRKSVIERHNAHRFTGKIEGVLTWMLVDTALQTGLRVSELAALQVKDIDFRRKALKVGRLKKKKKVVETLGISDDLIKHLKDYLDDRTTGPLFVGKRGRLKTSGLQSIWRLAIRRAGLPKSLSIHSARHTVGYTLLKKTGNLRMVQKQLGHSSPTITANIYADIDFETMREGMTGLYDPDASSG